MRYCECEFPDRSLHKWLGLFADPLRCGRCHLIIEDDVIAEDQRNEDYDQTVSDWRER